jgi:hypothetical protein
MSETMTVKSSRPDFDGTLKDFLRRLNGLDLGPLAYKLMSPEDRPGLSLEQAGHAIQNYKGFLFLCYANPGAPISPSRYIDYVWHTHILDTELYCVQTATLFGSYLHHFPFFGKRDEADEKKLLAAANFTKSQALSYFGWDDDDWCGTGRGPRWPGHGNGLADLVSAIFPSGVDAPGRTQNPDVVTIQAGNFKHTVEHIGAAMDDMFTLRPSRLDRLADLLRLPIWVIVCMPIEVNVLNQVFVLQQADRLAEISQRLVEQRLTPTGFSTDLVNLQLRH